MSVPDHEAAWPQKGRELFVDGGEYHEFSHFGWGNVWSQLVEYMDGYKAAADSLVDRAIESGDISVLDTFVFPIFFLYRQYLELVMKHIYSRYSRTSREDLSSEGHNLEKIWNQIKPLLLQDSTVAENEDVGVVENYIGQFHVFDNTSLAFRYPMTKDLAPVQSNEKRVSLPNLKQRMNELANFFDGADG